MNSFTQEQLRLIIELVEWRIAIQNLDEDISDLRRLKCRAEAMIVEINQQIIETFGLTEEQEEIEPVFTFNPQGLG